MDDWEELLPKKEKASRHEVALKVPQMESPPANEEGEAMSEDPTAALATVQGNICPTFKIEMKVFKNAVCFYSSKKRR